MPLVMHGCLNQYTTNVNVSFVCFAMSSRAKTVGPILGASDVPNEVGKA